MKNIEYPNLEPLFRPRSIAVIGASDDVTKPSGLPVKYALDHGYKGKLFPVNPKRDTVQGIKAYPSLNDIPEDIDACVIVVPAQVVTEALQECVAKGVKAAVIGVSGFAELNEEGKERQNEIERIARESGMRICGPNTNGLLNVHEGISLGYSYAQEVVIPGRLAYISQSGALLSATVPRFSRRGVGLSHFVGVGNQVDLETFDYVRYVIDDPNTDVIAVYVEGIKSPLKFLDVADLALRKQKPLVILKIGRSELSVRAAMSHTGSLVGSDAVFDAVCKQKGIARADDFDTLVAVSSVFLNCKLSKGEGIGIVSSSGGAIGLVADHASAFGLKFPDLTAETKAEAAKIIPAYGEMRSPFDIAGAGATALRSIDLTRKAVELMLRDGNIDILLAIVTPMDRRGTENYVQALVEVSKAVDKPVIMFCPMGGLRENEDKIFTQSRIPMLTDAAECVRGLSGLIEFSRAVKEQRGDRPAYAPEVKGKAEEVKERLKSSGKALTEHESKKLLSQYGIPITEEEVAKSVGEAIRIAARIGYPVALKVDSPDILHKTEAQAIKLHVSNENELKKAYDEVLTNAKKFAPKAEIGGVLVQEMSEAGREMIVGMSDDPQFGPTIIVGLGGVFVEVFKDVSLRVAPLSRTDAEKMVGEIKGSKILKAFRGKPEADIEALIDTLLKLSRLSVDLAGAISQIDINPLMVLDNGKGVKVVDALVVFRNGNTGTL